MRDRNITIENASGLGFQCYPNAVFAGTYYQDQLSIQLNSGSMQEFACSEAFLRVYEENRIVMVYPLRRNYAQVLEVRCDALTWCGQCDVAKFSLSLQLAERALCWQTQICIEAFDSSLDWDIVWLEDRGLANPDFLRGSELYASQYLDWKAIGSEKHQILCCRQNLSAPNAPWLAEGIVEGSCGFATNGHRFYGKGWEKDGFPQALWGSLGQVVEQEQFAVLALQSQRYSGIENRSISIVSAFQASHGVTDEQDMAIWLNAKAICESFPKLQDRQISQTIPCSFAVPEIFHSEEFEEEELEKHFPSKVLCESQDGRLAAFFTPEHRHVVLQHKERFCPQAHVHMIRGGTELSPSADLASLSATMNGCFIGHYSVGNTLFNSMISSAKFHIDLFKYSGLRLSFCPQLEGGTAWQQLGLPAAFVMDFFSAEWFYKIVDDILHVRVSFEAANCACLRIRSEQGQQYAIKLALQLEDGANGAPHPPTISWLSTENGKGLATIQRNQASMADYGDVQLKFPLWENLSALKTDDPAFFSVTGLGSEFSMQLLNQAESGPLFCPPQTVEFLHLANEERKLLLNACSYWFSHNALIHFSVLYGTEQMKGAAWGVRDVLQGSLEYCFMAEEHETAATILRSVLSQQRFDTGDWPQWFMMGNFAHIRDAHSHGDIIIWVLKAVCEYIRRYGMAILEETLPFYLSDEQKYSDTRPVAEHIEKLLDSIGSQLQAEANFLPAYSGGDWNDSLQPADEELKKDLISVWSAILLAQYLGDFHELAGQYQLPYLDKVEDLMQKVQSGVARLFDSYDYPPGFLLIQRGRASARPLMHCSEQNYPINYRLLPLKRAIKSKLVSRERAEHFQQLICEQLSHQDGTRLLDYVLEYQGGASQLFKRLEQAAYFGREIGLMYTHAHLRYVEALLDLRMGQEALAELEKVLPMQIQERVPNALPRQANSYFASSDLSMATRYEFSGVLDGDTSKKMAAIGGWRIYSSGPGIMLSLLHNSILGIKRCSHSLVINPVLTPDFQSLEAQIAHPFTRDNGTLTIRMHIATAATIAGNSLDYSKLRVQKVYLDGAKLSFQDLDNAYGYAGVEIRELKEAECLLELELA